MRGDRSKWVNSPLYAWMEANGKNFTDCAKYLGVSSSTVSSIILKNMASDEIRNVVFEKTGVYLPHPPRKAVKKVDPSEFVERPLNDQPIKSPRLQEMTPKVAAAIINNNYPVHPEVRAHAIRTVMGL